MRVERPSNHSRIVVLTTGLPEAELKPVSHPVRVELRCPAYPLRRTNAVIVLARPTCQYAEGRKGDEYRISNTRDFTLEIPKYSGADSLLRQTESLPQCKAKCALPTGLMVTVGETMQDRFFSFLAQNSSAINGNSSSAQSRGAQRRELSTPQCRFREGYRKIPHESRPTSEMSNATMSKYSDDENDDFSLLTNLFSRRTLNLTFTNAFPAIPYWTAVEIVSLRRI